MTPAVPHAVAVFDRAFKHIRYRLDPPVGMPGETRDVMTRVIGMEVVKEQEWIELRDR
jgi:hypothetical protein